MKKLLLLLAICIPFFAFTQVERMPNLTASYNASQSGGDGTTWTLTGSFSDASGVYDASGVQVGDVVFFSDGTYTFFLPITEIVSAMHPTLTIKVSKVGITQISSVGSGMKAIFHPTSKGYFPFVSGISNADQQVYNEYLMSLLDKASSCERALSKAGHGFSPWTPVHWNGSDYEIAANDTIVPDYIVVDSIDANNFIVATCGAYPTTLDDGLYWYTSASPGYSLIQDTTKVALFQVIDGELVLSPIVGFNFGATVTSTELRDTAAAIRADFPNGIISALPLGNVIIPANGHSIVLDSFSTLRLTGRGTFAPHIGLANKSKGNAELWLEYDFRNLWGNYVNPKGFAVGFGQYGAYLGYQWPFMMRYDSIQGSGWFLQNIYGSNYMNSLHRFQGGAFSGGDEFLFQSRNTAGKRSISLTRNGGGSAPYFSVWNTGKVLMGQDSSFVHDPVVDSTLFKGTIRQRTDGQNLFEMWGNNNNGNANSNEIRMRDSETGYIWYLNQDNRGYGSNGFRLENYNGIGWGNVLYIADLTRLIKLNASRNGAGIESNGNGSINTGESKNIFIGNAQYSNTDQYLALHYFRTQAIKNTTKAQFGVYRSNSNSAVDTASFVIDKNGKGIFYEGLGTFNYDFTNAAPSSSNGAISTQIQTGTGAAKTASWLRSQHKTISGTTDGSGDITINFDAAMPDATYTVISQNEGTTAYILSAHTKATGSVKVRVFDAAGIAVTSTSVTISYEVKDY